MKFHLNQADGLNLFTAYGDDYVAINHQRYEQQSLLVTPECVETSGLAAGFDALNADHCTALIAHQPEIVLLGTGARLRFPHPSITAPLMQARIGLDVMDNRAACRTYNILVSEGRRVLVLLLAT